MRHISVRSKIIALSLAVGVIFAVSGVALAMQKSRANSSLLAKNAQAKSLSAVAKIETTKEKIGNDTTTIPVQNVEEETASAVAPEVASSPVIANVAPTIESSYPLHKNISVTYFWAGEEADADNKNISNLPSAWDDDWVKHFGGVDNPKKRNGLVVANFTPKENSFYFALPYNDFDENGDRKKDVTKVIPWAADKKWVASESMLKNQWIAVTKGGKTAYAQWEDVGPFGEDDSSYVFGNAKPKSKTNEDAGLDVSPATKDFLGISDIDKVDWKFVKASEVPDGPWKKTITTAQIYWN